MSAEALEVCLHIVDEALAGKRPEPDVETIRHTLRDLSDSEWHQVQDRVLAAVVSASENLDVSEDLASAFAPVADMFDPQEELAVAARSLGLVAMIPYPVYGGDTSYWSTATEALLKELELVYACYMDGLPLTVTDVTFFSDVSRSAAGGNLFYTEIPRLLPDPLTELGVSLPEPGEVISDMTAVSLLTSSDEVASATAALLTQSGALIDPRIIHLFCDEANTIQPWWIDLYKWTGVIGRWKEVNADCWDPGFNDARLLEQFERSITWSNYRVPEVRNRMQQDDEMFTALAEYLRSLHS